MHLITLNTMIILSLSTTISATSLYVSSYTGNIAALSLTVNNGSYSLRKTGSYPQCGPNPSWLTIDNSRGLLFCLNEGLTTPNGSLSSFTINDDGSLSHVQNTTTISGPVSGITYGSAAGRRAIALAHYTGSALSTFYLDGAGRVSANQQFTFSLSSPGPNPSRQEAPHEHEAITDPTGHYILVPDLGADLVRVYSWSAGNLRLTEHASLKAASGSGPRHAAFYTPHGTTGGTTYMYLAAELASTVTGYELTYHPNNGGLGFRQIYVSSTFGFTRQPPGNAPAEILVTPDNRFVLISNRNASDTVVPVPVTSLNASTYFPQMTYAGVNGSDVVPHMEVSDSISTFRINDDGTLSFIQLAPSGGIWPRTMSVSPDGSMLAVGLQYTNRTVVYERDISSGLLGDLLASVEMSGPGEVNITAVVWGT